MSSSLARLTSGLGATRRRSAYGARMSPGEQTDVARLAAALLDALQDHFGDPDVAYSAAPQRLGGGKFSQVFTFMLSRNGEVPRSYVLRLLGSASDQACLEAGLHAAAQAEHL